MITLVQCESDQNIANGRQSCITRKAALITIRTIRRSRVEGKGKKDNNKKSEKDLAAYN